MGEYYEIVKGFAELLKRRVRNGGTVSGEDISVLIGGMMGFPINCYPGIPSNECCDIVFAISLISPSAKKYKKGHLWFEGAIDMLYKHIFDICPSKTKAAVLIVDSWNPEVWERWRDKIEMMKKVIHFEVYLLVNYELHQIDF